jgi:hypothetical protein
VNLIDECKAAVLRAAFGLKSEDEGRFLRRLEDLYLYLEGFFAAGRKENVTLIDRLRAEIKQMEKDHREDLRSAGAQATHAERYPDEPPGLLFAHAAFAGMHFRIAKWSGAPAPCVTCGNGTMWTVVFGEGDELTEIGQAWGDYELVEDICDLMNDAFEAGMVHGRVA